MKKKICLLMSLLMMVVFVGGWSYRASSAPTTLVLSTWGYNEDLLRKNVFEPFEKANNVKIVLEVGNNGDRLNKLKMMKNSTVDVIFLAESFSLQGAKDGLFEKINESKIPNLKLIYDVARAPMKYGAGPAYTINRTGIVYDTKAVKKPITSWADLWRTDLKSKITIPSISSTSGPFFLAAAAKKVGTNLTVGADKAFAQMSALKPNIVKIYSKSSEFNNMFNQQEVVVGVAQDFAFPAIKQAIPTAVFVDPKEGSYANMNTINIVKSSKNKALAYKLVNFWLSVQVQKANAIDKIDSPVNKFANLTSKQAAGLTYGKDVLAKLKTLDWNYINGVMPNWIDKWNREMAN
jgi:putative spermidine/putrescine transport system substrate-binding protein